MRSILRLGAVSAVILACAALAPHVPLDSPPDARATADALSAPSVASAVALDSLVDVTVPATASDTILAAVSYFRLTAVPGTTVAVRPRDRQPDAVRLTLASRRDRPPERMRT